MGEKTTAREEDGEDIVQEKLLQVNKSKTKVISLLPKVNSHSKQQQHSLDTCCKGRQKRECQIRSGWKMDSGLNVK